jgi:hypothetical protein
MTPEFTAPSNIVEKIRGLGDVIKYFNDNDTSSLENFIDNYNQKVSAKEKIDIGPEIKGMMLNFHNQLLQVIDSQLTTATAEEKKEVLKARLRDNRQLDDMLRMYYNQKMKDVETRVMNDDAVKNNPEVFDTVRAIMNNVKSLKVKYKFFEYKYMQLNIFMIVFIQYVYNSMTKFIVDVIAYNQTRDAMRQEMTKKIFQATQQILGASDIQLKAEDAEAINKMIHNLQEKVQKDQQEIQELSSKLKNGSLADLLNFVMTSDDTLASHIMDGVEKYRSATSSASMPLTSGQKPAQVPAQAPAQVPAQAPAQVPAQAPAPQTGGFLRDLSLLPTAFYAVQPKAQKGGFIRDASLVPKAFYDLHSS